MKNMKGFIPTTALLVTMIFGATAANAGIIISDKAETPAPSCKGYDLGFTRVVKGVVGIIISDLTGIIISDAVDKTGIIISDKAGCSAGSAKKDGIIISD